MRWLLDHSWLVYTDYALWATRVSGSPPLIGAIFEDGALEAIRRGQADITVNLLAGFGRH
jgi:hypothetical protein